MNNNNNTVSKVLGFIAMAFGIISIPMIFTPLMGTDSIEGNSFFWDMFNPNVVFFFQDYFDYEQTESLLVALVCLAITIFTLVGVVLIPIFKKACKIIGCIFISLALVITIGLTIYFIRPSENTMPGIGEWIMIACLLIASVLSIISAVKFKTVVTDEFEESGYGEYYDDGGNYKLPQGEISFYGGSCAGYNIPIPSGVEVLIGKDPAVCQVVIDKSYGKVSRKHCGVRYDSMSGMYMVTDYSSNGTFIVNGQRLASNQTSYLGAGTTLNLAKTDNTFRLG